MKRRDPPELLVLNNLFVITEKGSSIVPADKEAHYPYQMKVFSLDMELEETMMAKREQNQVCQYDANIMLIIC